MVRAPHITHASPSDFYIHPTRDGSQTLFSHRVGATYHSVFGAVSESKHVFIQYGLAAISPQPVVRILEFGFGTGLNALLAWGYGQRSGIPVSYTGIESVRLPAHLIAQLGYPAYLGWPEAEEVCMRMHREDAFEMPGFSFALMPALTPETAGQSVDCVFFDAFAPGAQPECWSPDIFSAVFQCMAPGALLVTYCAQGEVRRRLQHTGFEVERLSGPPGKREMLRARRPL